MSEWKEYSIKRLIEQEKIAIGDGYRAKNEELSTEGLPFARAGNINNGFHFDGADCLPFSDQWKVGNKVSKPMDIVFTSKGTVGRFGFVTTNTPQFVYSPQLCFWRSLDQSIINSRWLYFWMNGREFWEQVHGLKDQTDMADYVNLNDQRNMVITIPPLPEQRAIAAVLSSLDDKIDLLHRQNKTLEALAETLFRQWFVEGAGTSTIQLGDIVEIYDSKRIPLSSTERDKMKTGALYPYYGAAAIMDRINDFIFDGEYLLFGEDGTVQNDAGFPVLQLAVGKYWVNNHAHVLSAKKPFSNFLLYTILQKTSVSHIVTGAVQPKISQENLKSLDIEIPCEEKILDTVSTTNNFWRKIQLNNMQIRTLESLRDTLLPKLMSGEVRVTL